MRSLYSLTHANSGVGVVTTKTELAKADQTLLFGSQGWNRDRGHKHWASLIPRVIDWRDSGRAFTQNDLFTLTLDTLLKLMDDESLKKKVVWPNSA